MDRGWNPWKATTLGLALVMATALVTGLVVANWSGSRQESDSRLVAPAATHPGVKPKAQPVAPRGPAVVAVPSQKAIAACNRQAAAEAGAHDKTQEVVKDAAIGAVVGAAVGAAGGAVAGGGKGAGKGAAIGGLVGAGGGTLYGLNENRQHDEKYRAAYSSCMRAHGYTTE